MGELGALFNPGMRHELEERQAKAARREEEGNAKDGDLRIDLESGVAVINAPDGQQGAGTAAPAASPAKDRPAASAEDQPAASAEDRPAASAEDRPAEDLDPTADDSPAAVVPKKSRSASPSAKPAEQLRPRGKRGVSAGR